MWSTRDIIIFAAGTEAFHTLMHIYFEFSGMLPLRFFLFTLTPDYNLLAITINAIATFALIAWANRLPVR